MQAQPGRSDGQVDAPEPLKETIWDKQVTNYFDRDGRKFLPEGMLDNLITEKAIKTAFGCVRSTAPKEMVPELSAIQDLTEYILKGSKKVFATVVMVGFEDYSLYSAMLKLKQAEINDSKLPIKCATFYERKQNLSRGGKSTGVGHGAPNSHDGSGSEGAPSSRAGSGSNDETSRGNDDTSIVDGAVWRRSRVDEFCDNRQWSFLSPVFSEKDPVHHLPSSCILPITESCPVSAQGGFAEVSEMKIHPSHFSRQGQPAFQQPQSVAVKKMMIRDAAERSNIDKMWEKETRALLDMYKLNQRHIVQFLSAFTRGPPANQEQYLILEWATGGNLRTLWNSSHRPDLTADLVKATHDQLLGLTRAIHEAHYPKSGPNFRHGDLKPENILWFKESYGQRTPIGTLKIGDWGLAKHHFVVTEMRSSRTRTAKGTRRYEPPEEALLSDDNPLLVAGRDVNHLMVSGRGGMKRSRLYDVWAFGCIMLEFLIWLMYDRDGLKRFNDDLGVGDHARFYLIKPAPNGGTMATVHDIVDKWMTHMADDAICKVGETALGDLLEIVRTQLLVIKLPQRLGTTTNLSNEEAPSETSETSMSKSPDSVSTSEAIGTSSNLNVPAIKVSKEETNNDTPQVVPTKRVSSGQERARSDLLLRFMLISAKDGATKAYWDPGPSKKREGPDVSSILEELRKLPPVQSNYVAGTDQGVSRSTLIFIPVSFKLTLNSSTYVADNEFAETVVPSIASSLNLSPPFSVTSKLCTECQDLREHILKRAQSQSYNWITLKNNAEKPIRCDLCAMLYRACKSRFYTDSIRVERDGSSININGKDRILSIFRSPGLCADLDGAHSEIYFELMRKWLNHCDEKHGGKCGQTRSNSDCGSLANSSALRHLPTRVIDVGKTGDPIVRLLETGPDDKGEWIALSHQWGSEKQFCTTTENLESHVKGISFKSLPATFYDAVKVTRALGCPYLWIDSICIVQEGTRADFSTEKTNMEKVYSGAYCVLASSRNPGHYAGFLQDREQRATLSLQNPGQSAPFYVTTPIDNFNDHVLEGSLNKRGWVLQEHALARRTIYFTDYQTYFECGDGVRCETMTKMTNELANFLGDPDFPQIMRKANRGEKILRYQNLYRTYSLLGLKNDTDRPLAIGSLQHRIQHSLDADGGFGVFDEGGQGRKRAGLLRRSLLWRRHDNTDKMSIIPFQDGQVVPSWSWMAHGGGIDYISPKFGEMVWKPLRSPWSSNLEGGDNSFPSGDVNKDVALVGEASNYNPGRAERGEWNIIFDNPPEPLPTKCVVLGIESGLPEPKLEHRTHYVLVIRATKSLRSTGLLVYERVGAGWLPGKCILGNCGRVVIY